MSKLKRAGAGRGGDSAAAPADVNEHRSTMDAARLDADAVALEALWYVPPLHRGQLDMPAVDEYEPAAHATGAVAPSTHAEPAGQSTQPDCPNADCQVPASHREHTDEPASAYSPAPHC